MRVLISIDSLHSTVNCSRLSAVRHTGIAAAVVIVEISIIRLSEDCTERYHSPLLAEPLVVDQNSSSDLLPDQPLLQVHNAAAVSDRQGIPVLAEEVIVLPGWMMLSSCFGSC